MMDWFRAASVIAMTCIGLVQSAAAAPMFEDQQLVSAGDAGYHTYRIPAAVVTNEGTVLLFLEGRKHGRSDFGETHMILLRSSDRGRSWGERRVIYKEDSPRDQITIGNPCPVVDVDTGKVWLAFTRDNQQVFVTSSADDGKTWQKPNEITAAVRPSHWTRYWTGPGHGIQLRCGEKRGRLLFPSYHLERDGDDTFMHSHMIYSDDQGKSWRIGDNTQTSESIGKFFYKANWSPPGFYWSGCECLAAELADGTLYLTVRNQVAMQDSSMPRQKAYATSQDGGQTWTPIRLHKDVIGATCQSGLTTFPRSADAKPELLLLSGITHAPDRRGLTLYLSRDGGQSWPTSRLVHKGPSAYSELAVLPDRTVLLFYEGGSKHHYDEIRLARFNLEWLQQEPPVQDNRGAP